MKNDFYNVTFEIYGGKIINIFITLYLKYQRKIRYTCYLRQKLDYYNSLCPN